MVEAIIIAIEVEIKILDPAFLNADFVVFILLCGFIFVGVVIDTRRFRGFSCVFMLKSFGGILFRENTAM